MGWRTRLSRLPLRAIGLVFASVLIGLALSSLNFGDGLGHVDIKMLSGSTGGNYAAVVDRLAARAAKRGGTIENVPSHGSVDNVQQLVDASDSCDVQFALVQDGTALPETDTLQLIGRLPRSETLFVIGRGAAKLTKFAELRGMKIGLGPKGSGTDHLGRAVLEAADLRPLGLRLSNPELAEQVDLLASGGLDLGVFVMDEDAVLIRSAIRERGLEIASLEHLGVAARVPFLSAGTIRAGHYDALAVIPARDHPVLRVDTLVVGNGCAKRSQEIGLLRVMGEELPGFFTSKQFHGGALPRSEIAKEFHASEDASLADKYVPWLVDIMPLGNWFYIVMSISVLFNVLTLWHKVRLWKIDAHRDKAFQIVRDALGEKLTATEILGLEPTAEHRTTAKRERLDTAVRDLDALRVRTRRQENSMLVPMGAEWMYRYEEEQMELLLTALRVFRAKLG